MSQYESLKTLIPFHEFKKPVFLQSAVFKQNYCLICKRTNVKLSRIRQQSIIYAHFKYKIFIKNGSRCCSRHLDERGFVRDDQFQLIRLKQ